MATTETTVKHNIKPEIRATADLLKAEIALDKKSGIATVDAGTYIKLLPPGLTKDIVEAVQAYNTQIVAAGALALGEMAIPVMKKDANLDRATLTIPMTGKDYIGVSFDRSRQVPSRDADNNPNGTKTKFGSTTTEIAMYGTKSRGQLMQVKNLLGELAVAAFGS